MYDIQSIEGFCRHDFETSLQHPSGRWVWESESRRSSADAHARPNDPMAQVQVYDHRNGSNRCPRWHSHLRP